MAGVNTENKRRSAFNMLPYVVFPVPDGYITKQDNPTTTELVTGGQDMEDAYWNDYRYPTTNEQTTHDGQTNCRHVVDTTDPLRQSGIWHDISSVVGGKVYNFNWKNKVITGQIGYAIYSYGGSEYEVDTGTITDSTWTERKISLKTTNSGNFGILFYNTTSPGANAEFYIDEVSFQQAPQHNDRAHASYIYTGIPIKAIALTRERFVYFDASLLLSSSYSLGLDAILEYYTPFIVFRRSWDQRLFPLRIPPYLGLDAYLAAKAYTEDIYVDSILKKIYQDTTEFDAFLQAVKELLLYTDSVLKLNKSNYQAIDAVLKRISTYGIDTYLDAVLTNALTRNLSLNGFLSVLRTTEAEIDAVLKIVKSNNIDLNVILLLSKLNQTELNAVLLASKLFNIIELDAVLSEVGASLNIDMDTILRIVKSEEVSTDAILKLSKTLDVNLDIILEKLKSATIMTDIILSRNQLATIVLDSFLNKVRESQQYISAVLKRQGLSNIDIEAVLLAVDQLKDIELNAILSTIGAPGGYFFINSVLGKVGRMRTVDLYALINIVRSLNIRLDTLLVASKHNSLFTDAIFKKAQQFGIDLNSIIKDTNRSQLLNLDTLLYIARATSLDLNIILNKLVGYNLSLDLDALLAELTQTTNIEIDAIIKAVSVLGANISLNAIMSLFSTDIITIDSLLIKFRTTLFQVDSVLRTIQTISTFSANAFLNIHYTSSFLVDSVLTDLGVKRIPVKMDAIIRDLEHAIHIMIAHPTRTFVSSGY